MSLISFSDITAVKDVSAHLEKNASQYLEEAELIDFKPLLGERFYYDLLENKNQSKYDIAWNGGTYQYDNMNVVCPGLKKVLIEYAYARIIFFGNETSTPFGLVEKQYQDGRNVERGRLKERYKATQQIAFQYWLEVQKYLDRNHTDFPKYCFETPQGLNRFKLRHVR